MPAEAEELRQAEGVAEAAARRRLKEAEVDGHGCRDDIVVRGDPKVAEKGAEKIGIGNYGRGC